MMQNVSQRRAANAHLAVVAIVSAKANGGTCAYSANHGIFVCNNSPLSARGGTTYGDVFLVAGEADPNLIVDGTSEKYEALLAHEARHAAQWAAYGASYVQAYARESMKSLVITGDVGCANWFEFDAGPVEGGYTSKCQ